MIINSEHIDWFDNERTTLIKTTPTLTYTIAKNCDILKITHIVFDSDPKLFTQHDEIIIMIPNQILYKSSLKLLTLLNEVTIINNKYILPVDFFNINLISTQFTKFVINITIHNEIFKKISFLTQDYFINNEYRLNHAYYGSEHIIKYPVSINKIIDSNQVTFIINSHSKIDGYYIEANISNIKSLSISLWNEEVDEERHELLNYDEIMINLYFKKINDNLLFVPLNLNKIVFFDKSLSNIFNSKNLICVKQSFIIKINFNTKVE